MAEVLVLVDHLEGEIKKSTFELLTAARALGEPSAVVVGRAGHGGRSWPTGCGARRGEDLRRGDRLAPTSSPPRSTVLASLVESTDPAAVLIAVSADGKEIAGRVAVRTGSGLLGDVVGGRRRTGVTHSVFGGAYIAEAKANTAHPVITLRPGSVEIEPAPGAGAEETVEVPARSRPVGHGAAGSRSPVGTGRS